MFDNVAVNTCLGIVFVILLYSLLATTLQEMLAKWLGLRPRVLLKGVRRMLEDSPDRKNNVVLNLLIAGWEGFYYYFIKPLAKDSFTAAFYKHPLIKYQAESTFNSKPGYLAADNFSAVLISLLKGTAGSQSPMTVIYDNLRNNIFEGFTVCEETRRYLLELWAGSDHDINKFDAALQKWYNDTMHRTTGWYKGMTQVLLLCIGFVIAVGFNVDLIAVAKILAHDDKARAAMVNMAISKQKEYGEYVDSLGKTNDTTTDGRRIVYVNANSARADSLYGKLSEDAADVGRILGLGRKDSCTRDSACQVKLLARLDTLTRTGEATAQVVQKIAADLKGCETCVEVVSPYQEGRWKFWGWLLTAIAISLGAPFWFSLLSKIMLLRGGKKIEEESTGSGKNTDGKTAVKPLG